MPPPATRRRPGPGETGENQPPDPFRPAYDLIRLRSPDGPLQARPDPTAAPGPGPGRRPMTFAARSTAGKPPGRLRRFVRDYGWRAYALPILTVATVLALLDLAHDNGVGLPRLGDQRSAPVTPHAVAQPKSDKIFVDSPGAGELNAGAKPTALPKGGPYTLAGGGRYDTVAGRSKISGTGPLRTYTVEVEAGVAEDGPAFAAAVEKTLGDPRSWGAGGRMSFQRVDSGEVDFRVSLTSAMTVRKLCGYTLPFETSCYNGSLGRAVINDARWVRGAVAFNGNLAAYRNYVINHEVGHGLGRGHEGCKKAGTLAPVMMQQTLGVVTPGVGACRANPWPHP
jgi:Protein of unknown function (DUF3152)